jgi:signal transduction histidine kinase
MFAFGLALFIGAVLTDAGYFIRIFHLPPFHMTGVAVLVFALCEAAAVFISTMKQQQHLEAQNAALESLSRMKTEYMTNISHETKGGYIVTTIRDSGTGIASELMPRVFERGVSGAGSTGRLCRAPCYESCPSAGYARPSRAGYYYLGYYAA